MMKSKSDDPSIIQPVVVFYALAFAISWLIWSPLIFIPAMRDFAFLIFIGAYGPLLAGMITTRAFEGRSGVRPWLKIIFKLRVGLRWYLLAIFLLPLLIAGSHLVVYLALGGSVGLSADPPWYWAVSVYPLNVILTIPLSSAFEEAGWQGYALPRLAKVFSPILANLVHGILWAAWHIPLYFTIAWKGGEPLGLLFAYTIPLSMILFWLTKKSNGSTFPAIFLHQATNHYGTLFASSAVFAGTLAVNFSEIKTLVYWGVAILLTFLTRGQLGCRSMAVSSVREENSLQVN